LGLSDQDFHLIPAKLMGHHIGSRPAKLYSLMRFSANCVTRL
jgi:hypothetical protein